MLINFFKTKKELVKSLGCDETKVKPKDNFCVSIHKVENFENNGQSIKVEEDYLISAHKLTKWTFQQIQEQASKKSKKVEIFEHVVPSPRVISYFERDMERERASFVLNRNEVIQLRDKINEVLEFPKHGKLG